MLSSSQTIRRKIGVRGVRKQKPGEARHVGKRVERKANTKKGKVSLLRQGSRPDVQPAKCSADRACAWPVVDRGLCVFHLRDFYG